ncbi:MAG: NAD(P)-binding domain-containing protein [Nitrospirota bacterium]|nr:NAD(P)-binding domain-containing protein [Nitrospirota bacterium]
MPELIQTKTIGIIGYGKMGSILASGLEGHCRILVHDIDPAKKEKAMTCGLRFAEDLLTLTEAEILFLVVGKKEAEETICALSRIVNKPTLLVNVATDLVLDDVVSIVSNRFLHPVSIKIIGEADAMSMGRYSLFVINAERTEDVATVGTLLLHLGSVITDDERRYCDINLIAAEEIMLAAGRICAKLYSKGLSREVVHTAVSSTSLGTLYQFPWKDMDYFHRRIFSKNKELPAIIEGSKKLHD